MQRFLLAFISFIAFILLTRIYRKTKYEGYLLLIAATLIGLLAFIVDYLAFTSKTLSDAIILYKTSAILLTIFYLVADLFVANEFRGIMRDFLILFISSTITLEIILTISFNPIIEKYDGYWILKTVRPIQTYLIRMIRPMVLLSIFSVYLIGFFKRTRIKKRKISIIVFITGIFGSNIINILNIIVNYPTLNTNMVIVTTIISVGTLFSLILADPFLFVFWNGKIFDLLIYREDGVLIYHITLDPIIPTNRLLISGFLSALSSFGSELFLEEAKLDKIDFKNMSVRIVHFEHVYLAIIGKDISPKIDPFAKNFLRKIYETFEEQIMTGLMSEEDFQKIEEMFIRELAQVVL